MNWHSIGFPYYVPQFETSLSCDLPFYVPSSNRILVYMVGLAQAKPFARSLLLLLLVVLASQGTPEYNVLQVAHR